jgi:four helix bundle protein
MPALHYRELIAGQKAMDLVEDVYRATKGFPPDELYDLTNQIRRASVSIPSNIAEGQGRGVGKEFAHHLRIANGSRQEVETQLLIAQRLSYLSSDIAARLIAGTEEVGRLLSGLLRSLTGN